MKKSTLLIIIILTAICLPSQAQKTETTVSAPISFFIDQSIPSPRAFIQKYVFDSVTLWTKKGRYETTAEYKERVTEENRQAYAKRLSQDAERIFLKKYYGDVNGLKILDYDADNESFLFATAEYGNIVVLVPRTEAGKFENSWVMEPDKTEFYLDNEVPKLKKLSFKANGKNYLYDNTQSAVYAATQINLQLPELELDLTPEEQYENQQQIISRNIIVGKSDVDINIPITNVANDKSFAVIIANENYRREASVPFAINDGQTFKEYCVKTLGIPEQHIHFVKNATVNDIRHEITWISNVMKTQNGKANVIIYYAGHGIPDETTKKAYLLPVDGYAADVATGYALDDMYQELGNIPAASITYFIDACFSGSKREEGMLANARGVAVQAKKGMLTGNAVAFSAASGEQTAYPYNEKGHGLFTYFLLKKLQKTSGNVTYKELGDYITEQVSQQSVITNNKMQTPSVNVSSNIQNDWQERTLK
ncbi:MAG: caspase family protein [Bacteroidales bacterium]|jgi:hypothetical protein|nr:caspase family protein [Bacteroidales bacterium]MDD3152342.1 caspase family protein [Bacteroidales bacterium]MDD3913045.1 caspase family protein [Bacteroidales bacterium]MDD4632960.1 caspase family protein [Bacteroidales bacterium]